MWGGEDYGWGDHACGPQISAAPGSVELISSLPLTGDTGKISLISLFFYKKACMCMCVYSHACLCVRAHMSSHMCSCVHILTCVFMCETYPYVCLCMHECSCVCSHACSSLYGCVPANNEPQQTLHRWYCWQSILHMNFRTEGICCSCLNELRPFLPYEEG